MSDTNRPEYDRVAYCQNCGKPLSSEQVRPVGSAIFCEPCLVSKVAAADAPGAGAASGAAPGYGYGSSSAGANYSSYRGPMPPPIARPRPGGPNPGLAALLGFIPGVGAFYNGQYAKGIVHLVVFATLTTLADRNGFFRLFVAGWIFYQVIEAHHTARARRDGTPLPNPFGLNDIGERLGFGKAWPGAAPGAGPATPPTAGPYNTGNTTTGGYTGGTEQSAAEAAAAYAPPTTASMPPASPYSPPASYAAAQPGYSSYGPPPQGWVPTSGSHAPGAPPVSSSVPLTPGPASDLSSRVPIGAIILIALGVLFLIGNSGWLTGISLTWVIPFLLIGLGVWLFVRKMTETGASLSDDGSPTYRLRLFRAARGPVWIILVGILFLLDDSRVLSWGRSWPLFIIVGGLMTFFERTAYSAYVPPPQPDFVPSQAAPSAAEPVASPPFDDVVPTHPQEHGGQ